MGVTYLFGRRSTPPDSLEDRSRCLRDVCQCPDAIRHIAKAFSRATNPHATAVVSRPLDALPKRGRQEIQSGEEVPRGRAGLGFIVVKPQLLKAH